MKKIIIFNFFNFLLCTQLLINSPSSYDTSFSDTGSTANLYIAQTINQAQDIIAQNDGKIITVGNAGENGIIVRYNNNGSLDTSFNTTGYVTVTIGSQTNILAVALQPADQKILIAGYAIISNLSTIFIARYNRNGTIDTTFNNTGYITTSFGIQSQLYGIALQKNGSIIVTGWLSDQEDGLTKALIACYTSSGVLDTTFGVNGYVSTLIGDIYTKAQDIIIQSDGKIIITGQAQINDNQGLIVIRYNQDGSLDETFNSSGDYPGSISPFINNSDVFTSQGNGLALQRNGSIIVVGYTAGSQSPSDRSYTTLRLTTDGSLDTTFNSNETPGYIINTQALQAQGVVIQSNGQIVTCGFNYTSIYLPVVIRYNNDGTIDPTFNFITNQNTANSLGNAVALQIDGKILVTGTIQVPYQTSAQ